MAHRFVERHYANPAAAAPAAVPAAVGKDAAASASAVSEEKKAETLSSPQDALATLERGLVGMVQEVLSDYGEDSERDEADNPFLYEGVGGAAYMALHVEQAGRQTGSKELAALVQALLPTALQLAQRAGQLCKEFAQRAHKALPPTFYCGTGGVWSTLTLAALSAGATDVADAAVKALLHDFARMADEKLPDELLYGRTGYLHSLLLVHDALSARVDLSSALRQAVEQLKEAISRVFDQIVQRGLQFKHKPNGAPLIWEWHGKMYLGAAHGITGILYELMRVPWRCSDAGTKKLLQDALAYCIGLRLASGNFPSSDSTDPDYDPNDKLVQWCHGAPALALACIKAYELWGEARHLQAATELAQVVWERGLLRKGIGLCHGIGGNGYVFLRLFEVTQDSTHLQRAVSFAQFALEGPHRDELLVQAEAPSSLANGRAGFACFLADCIALSRSAGSISDAGVKAEGAEAAASSSSQTAARPRHRVHFPGMDGI